MHSTPISLLTLRTLLLPRPAAGHKDTFGHALIVAGQYGMAGAAILAAKACLRSGVGKVTMHIPLALNDVVQIAVPEAIVHHDAAGRCTTEPVDTTPYDAMAIGPGLGTAPATAAALAAQLQRPSKLPLVLDADALNILAADPSLLDLLPPWSILTPHPGEWHRLAGGVSPVEFAIEHGVIVVAKGHPTTIYFADGTATHCPWGNNGMGTAGSGDVLTGVIVALLAQGYSSSAAAVLGVALHALAGDAAALDLGPHSVTASDIIAHLPSAFRTLVPPAVAAGHPITPPAR